VEVEISRVGLLENRIIEESDAPPGASLTIS
jgi:hypothetical protein